MSNKDENMEWKDEAVFLASLSNSTPYRVPEKYFDDLSSRINQSIFVSELEQKEDQGFAVPSLYFEELGNQIESRIAADHIGTLVVNDGFKVPDQYFDRLEASILAKTSAKLPKPKVSKLWHSDFIRYASAACFVIIAGSGLYFSQLSATKQSRTSELANEQMLYDIDESVIIEHIKESQTASASPASDQEMEKYILDNYSSSDLSNNL